MQKRRRFLWITEKLGRLLPKGWPCKKKGRTTVTGEGASTLCSCLAALLILGLRPDRQTAWQRLRSFSVDARGHRPKRAPGGSNGCTDPVGRDSHGRYERGA